MWLTLVSGMIGLQASPIFSTSPLFEDLIKDSFQLHMLLMTVRLQSLSYEEINAIHDSIGYVVIKRLTKPLHVHKGEMLT